MTRTIHICPSCNERQSRNGTGTLCVGCGGKKAKCNFIDDDNIKCDFSPKKSGYCTKHYEKIFGSSAAKMCACGKAQVRPGTNLCFSCNKDENYKNNIKEKQRIYENNKYHADPNYKLSKLLRKRIKETLINNVKSANTEKLLYTNFKDFKIYIESKFTEFMNWNNCGDAKQVYGKRTWHIDHIIPISLFDLSNPIEQSFCFNYRNMQPLWSDINLKKGNKLITPTKCNQDLIDLLFEKLNIKFNKDGGYDEKSIFYKLFGCSSDILKNHIKNINSNNEIKIEKLFYSNTATNFKYNNIQILKSKNTKDSKLKSKTIESNIIKASKNKESKTIDSKSKIIDTKSKNKDSKTIDSKSKNNK